ncbi:MAG: sulfite exporter TauE/SafE family protein [Clostridia bacterium]|nr:sulfite exporter TauE/SafE family protein [Clostridia bacterium]
MIIIIGIISGIVTSLGLGGGAILIIGLTLFLGIEQRIAQSVNLIFFIPTAITAIILNSKRKIIKWKTAIPVIIASGVSAGIGANLATQINTLVLKKMFGGFLGIIAIYEIYSLIKGHNEQKNSM